MPQSTSPQETHGPVADVPVERSQGDRSSAPEDGRPAIARLPLDESPIRGYMMYSYHLSVTFTHVDAWPWFYTNFVQLQCNPAQLKLSDWLDNSYMPKGEVHFTEGTSPFNPWLTDCTRLDEATMEAHRGCISSYIVENLAKGFYVETYLDEYFIPSLFNGGNHHFGHRLLIFGYDDVRRTFDIMGFDKSSQYCQLECRYEEVDTGFFDISPQYPARTRLFKPDPDSRPPAAFDPDRFVKLLDEYLASTNTLLNPDLRGDLKKDTSLWYGLKVYEFLSSYILNWIELHRTGVEIVLDFRGFHVLWEHKQCMANRLRWLSTVAYPIPDSLHEGFAKVLSLTEAARTRAVMTSKELLPMGKGYLREVVSLLEQARTLEVEVLQTLARIIAAHGAPSQR